MVFMHLMSSKFLISSIAVVISLIFTSQCIHAQPSTRGEEASVPVVDFEGFSHILSMQDDTVRVINFWATWCVPCVKELPYFKKASRELDGMKVKFIYVSMDMPSHMEERVLPFIRDRELRGTHFLLDDPDANSWIPMVYESWTGAIPATLIYIEDNRFFREGPMEYSEIMKEVNDRL